MQRLLSLLFASALAAFAADVNGDWKATAEGPNGTLTRTFKLKAEGATLTGETVSSMFGKSEIKNGKIDGDKLSFSILVKFQDNETEVKYTGKVTSKDEIKFSAEIGGGQTIEWLAKRGS